MVSLNILLSSMNIKFCVGSGMGDGYAQYMRNAI